MKILQIILSLCSGGAERFVVDLSNELAKNNDITLLTLKDDTIDPKERNFYKFDVSPKVRYLNLGLGDGPWHPSYPFKIYKAIKDISPDIVHIHGQPIIKYCFYASFKLGRKMTFIQTIHADLYHGYTDSIYRLTYRILVLHGKLRWVALSDTNFNQIKKEYPKAKSMCIYNGRSPILPTKKFKEVGEEIYKLKDNTQTKVFLHVARCSPQKNQKLLISSFNKLRVQGRNAILLVIGTNFNSEEGKLLKDLSGKGIYFLGAHTNISDYMLQSDVFVLSSIYEGMPITLLEAMLSGTPMVSTPVTGAVDVINGKNGILSKDFTESSYVAALNKMLDNLDKYKAEAMKEKDNSPYTIKHCAEQYMEFYKE